MAERVADPIETLRAEFREQLNLFYARLRLAPPYHSVEKAVARLVANVKALPAEAREQLISDGAARWRQFERAFTESGLHQKHRGIIAGLIRSGKTGVLPPEHEGFLKVFTT
jgi:hypothetical protein